MSENNFETQLAELEAVVQKLERGDLTLEENVALFERGMVLSGACKQQLAEAETRIEKLLNPRADGPVQVEALEVDTAGEEFRDFEDVPDDGRL